MKKIYFTLLLSLVVLGSFAKGTHKTVLNPYLWYVVYDLPCGVQVTVPGYQIYTGNSELAQQYAIDRKGDELTASICGDDGGGIPSDVA
ncbi:MULTISPECIES: hypothetical protein [Chitinophagaceae]